MLNRSKVIAKMNPRFNIILATSKEIEGYLGELARLRIEVFRDFPYLYDGSLDYEERYLRRYSQSPTSLAILVFVHGNLVAASTCQSMQDEDDIFKKSIDCLKTDVKKICYFGESIVRKEYRKQGLGKMFFEKREEHARQVCPQLEMTMFCAVNREHHHPQRPREYKDLSDFWLKLGYVKNEKLNVLLRWKDIDQPAETEKSLSYWLKHW